MTLAGHEDRVMGCEFANDNQRVVTCGFDRVAILWDVGHVDPSVLSALTVLAEKEREQESWID